MALAALTPTNLDAGMTIRGRMLASGQSRELYEFEGQTDLLLKVRKSKPPQRRFFTRFAALRALRNAYKEVVPLRREIREYERVANEGSLTDKHLQRFAGLVHTDRGIGMSVLAVRNNDGELALTLRQIIDAGQYNARTHSALSEFLEWFVSSKLVAADVHLANIVLNEKDNALVLIDGIGDKTFLPVRAWLPPLNKLYKKRLAKALLTEVAVRFMNTSFRRQLLAFAAMAIGTALGIDMMDGQLFDG